MRLKSSAIFIKICYYLIEYSRTFLNAINMIPRPNLFCYCLGIDITEIYPEILQSKAKTFDYKKEREKGLIKQNGNKNNKPEEGLIGLA